MSPFRPLYDWALRQAERPGAPYVLFGVAFAESSFFPLPPDILLLPMALAQRTKAWLYATICTAGSVLGGLGGYALGALFYATLGRWIIDTYGLQEGFERFSHGFQEWGVVLILIKGLTPIPFKLVTIASGVAHLDLVPFVAASFLTRGARFFLVAALVRWLGEPVRTFVEKYLTWVGLGLLALIVGGFWIALR